MIMYKKRSISSSYWMKEHFSDKYVQQAQEQKLRSRAWFKIEEIQKKDKVFKPGMTVIDLGAAPGSWSQYVISQLGANGRVIACDLLPMPPIIGIHFFQGDFCDAAVLKILLECVGDSKVQVIMSDMSPNLSGVKAVDIPRSIYLAELALKMCHVILASEGSFIVKIFQGDGFDAYLRKVRSFFTSMKIRKPKASRLRSREVYIVATGHKLYV